MDRTVEELEKELRATLNMTVQEYFSLLTHNLSRMETRSFIYDKSDGILWVILTPLVYFVLVSVVLTILLLYYWYTDGPVDISPTGSRDQNNREPEEIDLPMGLNRTFLNIDGASQVMTRSSSMSKGSVRSLGTLTDLDQSATTRVFNKVFTNSKFSPLNFSQRESLGMAAFPGRKSDRSTVEGYATEQRFNEPGSGRSLNLSDFQVKYPPAMLADQFKLVWVSGDDVPSDGVNDAGYSVVSSDGGVRCFHASVSTNKQTTTRDLNKSKGGHEKTGKRLAMREQLLKYGIRMNKTSCLADSTDQSTFEISAPRNYTDPISRHCPRGLAPNSLSSGGSYLDYLRGSKVCMPDSDPSDEHELRRTRRNGRELFNRLSESDDVNVHVDYDKEGEHRSISEPSLAFSCGQMDMSDYQELDYFDTCGDQLEEISGDLDLTTPSARGRATSSMSEVFCADESSENSPPLSLPSSISRFHYSKKGAQALPQAQYPFAETQGADAPDDNNVQPDGNDTADVSLYPNEGSYSQTATVNTSRLKSNPDWSSQEVHDRLDKVVNKKSNPSLQHEARPPRTDSTFSGDAKLKSSFSEPDDETSINDKKERIKTRKRFSLDALNCGRVTVEDRLTEFGFLKPSGNKYVINPSPGRFFRRGTNQSSGGIDDGDGFSDYDPPSFSDHDSLTQGKQADTDNSSRCSNSRCYGTEEPLSLAALGAKVFGVKRDVIEDSNNNNNLTYVRGGYDTSSTGAAPESLDGGSGTSDASVNQYRGSGNRYHSVSIELSTEGHFVESSEDRRKSILGRECWQWKEEPHKDFSVDEGKIKGNSNTSSLGGRVHSSHTKPPLPSRLSDASYQKTVGRPVVMGDKNGVSRISDEVNTTFKLQQFRLHRKSTVNLFKMIGSGQSADSNSQDSDFFAKQHPSLMTPPTPDSNGDDRMFNVAADHRYTSTPLYRQ